MYLLDTCVISDFLRGHVLTTKRCLEQSPSVLHISALTYFEMSYGFVKAPWAKQQYRDALSSLMETLQVLPFSTKESVEAAKIRHFLTTQGKPIGAYDVLIASTALANNCIMVTANEREFRRVPDLTVENWRR